MKHSVQIFYVRRLCRNSNKEQAKSCQCVGEASNLSNYLGWEKKRFSATHEQKRIIYYLNCSLALYWLYCIDLLFSWTR